MKVRIINRSTHDLPSYATEGSAGMDLRAFISESIEMAPFQRVLISTGIFIELPIGFEAQIRTRSGMAFKNGIAVLNSPGTIDADYRGEIKVLLINLSSENYIISNGERIAQMVVAPHFQVEWVSVEELPDSIRGMGGFGHTGMK